MPSKMTPVGTLVNRALAEIRPSRDIGMVAIWDLWDDTAGPGVCENAKPAAFRNGTLIVHVSCSAWLHQLGFMKQTLIEQLNHALGDPLVKEIRFQIARLHH